MGKEERKRRRQPMLQMCVHKHTRAQRVRESEGKKWHEIFMFMAGLCIEMTTILLCVPYRIHFADPIFRGGRG